MSVFKKTITIGTLSLLSGLASTGALAADAEPAAEATEAAAAPATPPAPATSDTAPMPAPAAKVAAKAAAGKGAKSAEKGPAAKTNVSKEDIDLWAFSTLRALAPGKTTAEFRALPKLSDEKTDDLLASDDATQNKGPRSIRFTFSDGMNLRVMDYGEQAFISHLRVDGPEHPLLDQLKIGSTRAEVEAVLGKPSRGGVSYVVYEGKDDIVRCFYNGAGQLSAVEIDTGG